MKNRLYPLTTLVLTALLSTTFPARAVDVETQQYNVNAAQKGVDEAKAELDEASQRVKHQNQRIAQEQAVLKDLQKKQDAAKANYNKAKAELETHQKALDDAWKQK
jgi:septal ring factor EnvC (AmiA/AmiB activator)